MDDIVFSFNDNLTPNNYKLTEETARIIIEALGNGVSYKHAAGLAGVDVSTLFKWMKVGKKLAENPKEYFDATEHERRCYQLRMAVKKSLGGLQNQLVSTLKGLALDGNDRALIYLLEQKFPEDFGKKAISVNTTSNETTDNNVTKTKLYSSTINIIKNEISNLAEEADYIADYSQYGCIEIDIKDETDDE